MKVSVLFLSGSIFKISSGETANLNHLVQCFGAAAGFYFLIFLPHAVTLTKKKANKKIYVIKLMKIKSDDGFLEDLEVDKICQVATNSYLSKEKNDYSVFGDLVI